MTSPYYKRTSIKKKGNGLFIPLPAGLVKRGLFLLNQAVEFTVENNKLCAQPLSQAQKKNLAQLVAKLKQLLVSKRLQGTDEEK